ncbi:MAG: FAD-dependent monooxygenase [Burkholderiales bacterium]|nr:FAD-dependent monooxygenase [Burkholderiales bacterium]
MARILVIGGSLGGLLAANMLWRAGHDVTVLEKVSGAMDGRGAGIVTHQALFSALQRAGLQTMDGLGVPVEGRVVLDAQGNTIAEKAMFQVLTSWSRLYEILRALLPAERYVQGLTVQSITTDTDVVTVQTSGVQGGTQWHADLVIASDGIRSAVRQQFAPQIQPVYAGYVAWRGVCEEAVLSDYARQTVFEKFGFGLPAGEQIIGYPVAGAGNVTLPGSRAYNFVWYRPAVDAQLKALLSDADGHHYPSGIAPNKVAWQQIAAMRQSARQLLAPQFAEMIEKTAMPFLQPIFDVASERIAFGRVALMGDASFVARPHIGMGVTKAAQDAEALCDAIDIHGASPRALQAYEQMRLPQGCRAVARARWLGAYMQAQTSAADGATTPRNAQDVLTETAIDLDVYGHLSSFPVP